MTRRPPVRFLCGVAFLALLTSCAGSGTAVDSAAEAASAASSATAESTGGSPAGTPEVGGNPGAPGADPADGGGGGGGGAKPGAPGDVAVFEEGGDAPYSALVDDAATKCAHGACTLLEPPIVLDGDVHRVEGGVGACTIAEKTDILYDPPAKGGRFPVGATVRAKVHCADVETPVEQPGGTSPAGTSGQAPANPDAGNSGSGNSDAGNSAGGTTTSGTADQPQG